MLLIIVNFKANIFKGVEQISRRNGVDGENMPVPV